MLRPHDSLLDANPAFAEVYPLLDARLTAALNLPEDETLKDDLAQCARTWTKFKILWSELQLVLDADAHKEFTDSLVLHFAKVSEPEFFRRQLQALGIEERLAFIEPPPALDERIDIFQRLLATAINSKLSIFDELRAVDDHRMDESTDLASLKRAQDISIALTKQAIRTGQHQIIELLLEVFKESKHAIDRSTKYLTEEKHGLIERNHDAFLSYHEVATKALVQHAQDGLDKSIEMVYTPETISALERHAAKLDDTMQRVSSETAQVEREIAVYESARTPEYLAAVTEYNRLTKEIHEAEADLEKLARFGQTSPKP